MKKLFYAGLELEEDLKMCDIFDTLEQCDDVIILSHGRNVEIIEQRYIKPFSSDRENTGKTHNGFEFHYINIYYNGYIWNIEPAQYYPFTDKNNPGAICATPYIFTGDNTMQQCGYSIAFETLEDLKNAPAAPLKGTYPKKITFYRNDFIKIYQAQAGNREKAIFNAPHILCEIQRDENAHIIRCAKIEREPDGARLYFDIELKRGKITG